MATKTLLNIEQYIALGEDPPGMRYELSDGELIVTPSSSSFHNEICDRLIARLLDFLDKHPLGRVISETDVQLSESTVRRPDVAFVSDERLQGVDRHHTPLAAVPNLVIEIVSPTDRAADLMKKVSEYLKAGVQAVWLFYPSLFQTYRYANERTQCLTAGDEFVEPGLLPGFTLKISEIFSWGE
jgi:Uma2 family endonuclease